MASMTGHCPRRERSGSASLVSWLPAPSSTWTWIHAARKLSSVSFFVGGSCDCDAKEGRVVDRLQDAHSKLLEGFSCTAVVAYLADTKGVSRRTAQRTVQQAYALIREDIDKANVQRSDLVAQAIHLLMESARLGLAQNNPGAVVGAVAQLDKLCGLSIARR